MIWHVRYKHKKRNKWYIIPYSFEGSKQYAMEQATLIWGNRNSNSLGMAQVQVVRYVEDGIEWDSGSDGQPVTDDPDVQGSIVGATVQEAG